jgi:hypothetical protein
VHRRTALFVLVAVGLAVLPDAPAARAQQATTITLSQTSGPPDSDVTVPIYFAGAKGVRAGSLELQVAFPAAPLTFVRGELSGLGEGVGAALEAKATPGHDESTLHVSLSTKGSPSREPVPDGPIAYLVFKLAKSAKPGAVFPLKSKATVRSMDDPPKPIEPVSVPESQIVVSDPTVTSCFFYMH